MRKFKPGDCVRLKPLKHSRSYAADPGAEAFVVANELGDVNIWVHWTTLNRNGQMDGSYSADDFDLVYASPSVRFALVWVNRGADNAVVDFVEVLDRGSFTSLDNAEAEAKKIAVDLDGEVAVMEVRSFHRVKTEVVSEAA